MPQHEHWKIVTSREASYRRHFFFFQVWQRDGLVKKLTPNPSRILGHVDAGQLRLHDQQTVVQVHSLTAVPHHELCRSEVLQNQDALRGIDAFTREWLPDSWSKEVFKMVNANVFFCMY